MRIISKFTDYYDCVQAYGQDRSRVYVRNEEDEELKNRWPFPSVMSFRDSPTWLKQNIIGFCGVIYPCLHVAYTDYDLGRNSAPEHTWWKVEDRYPCTFVYNLDEMDAFVHQHYKKRHIEIYESDENRHLWRYSGCRRKYIKEFFEKVEKVKDKHAKRFEEHLSPIFVASLHGHVRRPWNSDEYTDSPQKIVWNSSLRELDFMRIKDPYTAYQELSMYMSNMAFPNKPIPKIDDKTMAEIKGFDKFSFRKDKAS